MDLDLYKKRLGVPKSKNSSQALVNATIRQVKSIFTESPLYQTIKLNNVEKGVRLSFEKDGEYQILLMPEETVNKGDIVDIDNDKWLVYETIQSTIYPKAKIKFCNQLLRWKDSMGNQYEFPSYVTGKTNYSIGKNDDYVILPDGQVIATVSYNKDTNSIKLTDRFIIGGNAYEVTGVDNITNVSKDTGLIIIYLEPTLKPSTDNEDSEENSSTDNGWGGGW